MRAEEYGNLCTERNSLVAFIFGGTTINTPLFNGVNVKILKLDNHLK